MSPHNLRLVLSVEAKADIVDILQYTYETWGASQASAYSAVMDKALFAICEHPHLGKKVPEISERHRVVKAGQHIIFYSVIDSGIHVARILHNKMDIKNHFS